VGEEVTLKLMSPGRGEARDLLVVFHVDPSAKSVQADIINAAGDAIVVNETFAAFKSLYASPTPLPKLMEWAVKEAGAMAIRRVVLAGFSEGCQGVRSQLRAGMRPEAVIACDGTHASRPPAAEHIQPWRALAERAKAGECVFLASHTRIHTEYLTTRETLELITGWKLTEKMAFKAEGKLCVYSWPGNTAAAHIEQRRLALPKMVAEAFALLDGTAPVAA
jgi:hypothetical protein